MTSDVHVPKVGRHLHVINIIGDTNLNLQMSYIGGVNNVSLQLESPHDY